jgi:hypothetical protein
MDTTSTNGRQARDGLSAGLNALVIRSKSSSRISSNFYLAEFQWQSGKIIRHK